MVLLFSGALPPCAIERIVTGGGNVVQGPHDVPGGDEILVGRDPQGATFCLVGKKQE